MKPFVHLHLHTEYSLLDGATRIEEVFDKARELNMPAVAITDHGNMYGVIDFFDAAKKSWHNLIKKNKYKDMLEQFQATQARGVECEEPHKEDTYVTKEDEQKYKHLFVKPIIGCEFYTADDMYVKEKEMFHLVLLAKDEIGYHNLVKLNSHAWIDGFYYKPRIDLECIKKHSEGLICLSACIAGRIPQYILEDNYEKAKEYAKELKSIFGEDFYLEIQDHGIIEEGIAIEKIVNIALIRLSKELNIKLVATNDVHYKAKEDAEMHDVLLCIQTGAFIDEENRMKFSGDSFYMKSYKEMQELFPELEEALDITVDIANKCNFEKPQKKQLMPNYQPDDGSCPTEFLRTLTWERAKQRYLVITEKIKERIEYELNVIIEMGFAEYYLIVWDFIDYALKIGVPVGAGRGSGVGSIVAYIIGITNVDPLKYNLIFERFLNKERISNPDFDIDFCYEERGKIIDYVNTKYGRDKVAQIITFGTLAAKAAIKDVARVYRMAYAEVDKITKAIPQAAGRITIKSIMGKDEDKLQHKCQDLITMYENNDEVRKVIDMAEKIEGMPRNSGMHAAGVVICSDTISDHIPLQCSDNVITTQFPKDQVEELGLLKMDFLGLTTLTDIKHAKEYVMQNKKILIDFNQLGYDDPKVYALIGSGDTDAVFQLESAGMKRFMQELMPTCFEDIIAGISLYRPGPMDSIPKYIYNKRNIDKIEYKDERLRPILSTTYGCIVYQEQVMDIVRVIGGYSYGRADILRRIMSKKRSKEMDRQRHIFLEGCPSDGHNTKVMGAKNLGMDEKTALELFDDMESFAKYAFNKSHAAAYAVLSYETAYMKCYYQQEFITSVMNNRINKPDDLAKYINYLKQHDVSVLPPDVNKCEVFFSTDGEVVRFGLVSIKGVGIEAAREVIQERKNNGPYCSLQEFFERQEHIPNKTTIEGMIKAGSFDVFGETRATLLSNYERVLATIIHDKKRKATGQLSLFDTLDDDCLSPQVELYKAEEWINSTLLEYEKEVLNVYLSGHPLNEYADMYNEIAFKLDALKEEEMQEEASQESIGKYDGQKVMVAGMLESVAKKINRRGEEMILGVFEDLTGSVEFFAFGKTYNAKKELFFKGSIVKITGVLKYREGSYTLNILQIDSWQKAFVNDAREEDFALLVMVDSLSDTKFAKVREILRAYSGNMDVYVKCGDKNYMHSQKVANSSNLEFELKSLLGAQNAIIREKLK